MTEAEFKKTFNAAQRRAIKRIFKLPYIPHYCHVMAQRACLHGDGIVLYHEGTFAPGCRDLAHAWNSVDGRIIDLSCDGLPMIVSAVCCSLYIPRYTYTSLDISMHTATNGGQFIWINDPSTLGHLHEETK